MRQVFYPGFQYLQGHDFCHLQVDVLKTTWFNYKF